MNDITVKPIEEFETISHGGMTMTKLREGLDVTSFGIQTVEIPPHNTNYPEHDHSPDGIGGRMFKEGSKQLGQEEVYVVLEGEATLISGDEEWTLRPGVFARVGVSQVRKIVTGDKKVVLLLLGGIPGATYDL